MIEGVVLRALRVVENDRGRVREIVRADDPDFPGFGQVHAVETRPGVRRAWFRHRRQVDQVAPLAGDTRVLAFDDRPDSPTLGGWMDVTLEASEPRLIIIPAMVWHGFTPAGDAASTVVLHNSQAFRYAEPDEEKRDPDDPYFPIRW